MSAWIEGWDAGYSPEPKINPYSEAHGLWQHREWEAGHKAARNVPTVTSIRVAIDHAWLTRHKNDVAANIAILLKLREAGVPVEGDIAIRGVRLGRLAMTSKDFFGEVVFEWRP
jgi:hypothetical protein